LRILRRGYEERRQLSIALPFRRRTRKAQVVREGEQALLGAVVEVALKSSPLRVSPLDDSRPRTAQVLELCEDLRLKPLVLHGETGCGSDLPFQTGRIHESGVVRDHRERASTAHDRSDRAPRLRRGRG